MIRFYSSISRLLQKRISVILGKFSLPQLTLYLICHRMFAFFFQTRESITSTHLAMFVAGLFSIELSEMRIHTRHRPGRHKRSNLAYCFERRRRRRGSSSFILAETGADCHHSRRDEEGRAQQEEEEKEEEEEEEKVKEKEEAAAARRRRASYLPRYLSQITLVLFEALGAGEPDLEELLDALEELHVVGAIVLGARHPPPPRRRSVARNYGAARNCAFSLSLLFFFFSLPLSVCISRTVSLLCISQRQSTRS